MSAEITKKIAFDICKASEIDREERTVIGVISTATIDRDKEVLLPKGVKLDNYLKNPVVLWAHKADQLPIGKTLWLRVFNHSIKAKVKFANTPMANDVFNLFKEGFLNAFSVGFLPLKGRQPTPDDLKANPHWADARYIYDEWELLEFSPVPIPANPEALAQAVKSKQFTFSDKLFEGQLLGEYIPQPQTQYTAEQTEPQKGAQAQPEDEEGDLFIAVNELIAPTERQAQPDNQQVKQWRPKPKAILSDLMKKEKIEPVRPRQQKPVVIPISAIMR